MRIRSFRLHAGAAAALLLAGAAVRASVEPQAGGPVAFVDFRVVTDQGEPVPDLTPSDVTLRIGGRVRALKSLELVRVGSGSGAAAPAPATLPSPFADNAAVAPGAGTRREVLIVVDELSISPGKEQPIREAIVKMLSAFTAA